MAAINPNDPEFLRSSIPASSYANRAYITIMDGVARIAFGDAAAGIGDTRYHTAITMSPRDLIDLADTIYQTINEAYPPAPPAPRLGALEPQDPFGGISPTGALGQILRKPPSGG
jgi:hypothetical protein